VFLNPWGDFVPISLVWSRRVMGRDHLISQRHIDAEYWSNVDIQDKFWRQTFVDFVRPLKRLFYDPISAGAHVLAAYSADPVSTPRVFAANPESFGALNEEADPELARLAYSQLVLGKGGIPICRCLELFHQVRCASVRLAEFADRYPTLYRELERQRAIENLKRKSVRVQFFGKSLYVDERYQPKMKRVALRYRTLRSAAT
jgi:hypothetical protein